MTRGKTRFYSLVLFVVSYNNKGVPIGATLTNHNKIKFLTKSFNIMSFRLGTPFED